LLNSSLRLDFVASVPDLPGCTSGGATVGAAFRKSAAGLTLWIEDALADGEKIPNPRSAEKLRNDPAVAAALAEGAILTRVPLTR
jgi:predicted RNase H-like HicB family nuclease